MKENLIKKSIDYSYVCAALENNEERKNFLECFDDTASRESLSDRENPERKWEELLQKYICTSDHNLRCIIDEVSCSFTGWTMESLIKMVAFELNIPIEARAYDIPNILSSIKKEVISGHCTLNAAAKLLHESNYIPYVDEELAAAKLRLHNNKEKESSQKKNDIHRILALRDCVEDLLENDPGENEMDTSEVAELFYVAQKLREAISCLGY